MVKHTQSSLSVFDHFVELALKGLRQFLLWCIRFVNKQNFFPEFLSTSAEIFFDKIFLLVASSSQFIFHTTRLPNRNIGRFKIITFYLISLFFLENTLLERGIVESVLA